MMMMSYYSSNHNNDDDDNDNDNDTDNDSDNDTDTDTDNDNDNNNILFCRMTTRWLVLSYSFKFVHQRPNLCPAPLGSSL